MNAVIHGKELEEIDRIISALVDSNEFYNVKSNMEAFLQHLESASKEGQTQIINRFSQRANNVIARSRFPSMPYNALIIPPEISAAAFVSSFAAMDGTVESILKNIRLFIDGFGDFTSPLLPQTTERDIKSVLNAAQRTFGMINIIAPLLPLRIFMLNCSHTTLNSVCLMLDDKKTSIILLFHPRDTSVDDNVFIFAHELGHALHYAITGDTDEFPKGFDKFNAMFHMTFDSLSEKQEAFASAAAIAILGSPNSRLRNHLSGKMPKGQSDLFTSYFTFICDEAQVENPCNMMG